MAQTTQRALAASLKKLLMTKTLDKITVKDLVQDCQVNRQTFYYHFQDIYALLDWIFTTESAEIIAENKTKSTWQKGFLRVFEYMRENQHLAINVYRSIGREQLEQYLYRVVFDLIYDVVDEQAADLAVSEEDKRFITDFYKYAFVGLVLEWLRTGMKEEPQKMIARLDKLISGDFRRALLKYQNH